MPLNANDESVAVDMKVGGRSRAKWAQGRGKEGRLSVVSRYLHLLTYRNSSPPALIIYTSFSTPRAPAKSTMLMNMFGNKCTICGNQLKPIKKKDSNEHYLRCHSPSAHAKEGGRTYWFHFAPEDTPTQSAQSASVNCAVDTCNLVRVNTKCTHAMCKKHCLQAPGQCVVHGKVTAGTQPQHISIAPQSHRVSQISSSSSVASSSQNPYPSSSRSLLDQPEYNPFTSFTDMHNRITEPLHALDAYQQGELARVAAIGRQFDHLPGLLSPSPELSLEEAIRRQEQLEAAELKEAIQKSLELENFYENSLPSYVSSQSPPPISASASGAHLRQLSASLDLPNHILPLNGPTQPTPTSIPTPSTSSSVPRVRMNAPSILSRSQAAPLQITRQLNNDWLSSTDSLPDTFHISNRGAAGRRPFKNPLAVRRFMLTFYGKASPDERSQTGQACRQSFITECPEWPSWQLSTARQTLISLGVDPGTTTLEQYRPEYKTWIEVPINFVYELTTDCVLLLRRQGVECLLEIDTIERFFPTPAPSHLRYGLGLERAAVRKAYKFLKSDVVEVSSGSESEGIEVSGPRKRVDKEEHNPRPRQRPRLSRIDTTCVSTPSTDVSPLCPPQTSSTPATTPPPSATTPPLSEHQHSPSPPPRSAPRRWPAGEYTVDVIAGFVEMKSPELARLPVDIRFRKIFGADYKQQTYNDQVRRWNTASEAQRQVARAAGRTPEGLWSIFAKNVPLRR
ncbi:hypothetical protein B0H17DRAFT_1123745 [Mycena rosella]|uniref:Uncharacterized protein n=1 Tax=Mycena rosella TaxID=1033263 RepID=A0AAD7MCD9_MYCRO|nr:hypothetical protein B0H17DRAFT_1123745 [Mycena rosella]